MDKFFSYARRISEEISVGGSNSVETMPSDLVSHFTQSLASSRPVSPSALPIVKSNTKKPELHSILVSFTQSHPTQSQIADCARSLQDVVSSSLTTASDDGPGQTEEQDEEEFALEDAIVRKLTVAIYADALDTYLAQAIEVEAEAEWWASVETSKLAVALFFLQSTAPSFSSLLSLKYCCSISPTSHECI
jgi:nuclear-control-of-ATPase protein 2